MSFVSIGSPESYINHQFSQVPGSFLSKIISLSLRLKFIASIGKEFTEQTPCLLRAHLVYN